MMDTSESVNGPRRSECRLTEECTVYIEVASSRNGNPQPPRLIISKTTDISANGIQVLFDYPLILNSILRLCIETGDGMRFILTGEVRRQLEQEEQTCIGFQLLESDQTDIALWKQYIARRLISEAT